MARMSRCIVALMCVTSVACTSETGSPPLRLGTTYTVEQSGALIVIESLAPPAVPKLIVGSSGQVLRSAAAGDLDVVLTHAPALERRLLLIDGHVALVCPFVTSRFAIVGPAVDPAHVADARSAADAFGRIAAAGVSFVSRGDSSGTHAKERELWQAARLVPDREPWYVQAGLDQASTLRLASERGAYALADLPTFQRLTDLESRVLYSDDDTTLANPYTLYVVGGDSANPAALRFAAWALDEWRSRIVLRRTFTPRAGGCAPPADAAAP